MPLRRSTRFLTFVLAAMQFAFPAVASVADGAFAKVVRDPGAHVESNGDNQCTPPHGADCAVCRYLSNDTAPVPAQPAPLARHDEAPSFVVRPRLFASAVHAFTQSRAPPAV